MYDDEKKTGQRAWQSPYAVLPVLVWIALASVVSNEGETWARARDLVATPPLMGSPLQVIESRMRPSQIQRFESRMLDSPLQLIGSPFGPYRFATLPNLQDLWATRQALPILPVMLQTRRGTLLLLPYFVLPLMKEYFPVHSAAVTEETAASLPSPRFVAKPKFFSARCGQFVEIVVPPDASLTDEENKPC
jgi:hypothetical protein